MARTKQTARKNTGGKSVATYPKPKPQSRKVILEYSSDENADQQVPGVELGKPKRVKKRITLTLPTKPTNVTLTASFHQFFIRHGMNRALWRALESRKWTLDQMQQFQTNYTAKHGTKIPPPKLYMDEGDSEEEGLELEDGTIYGRQTGTGAKPKPPGGPGGSGRGSGRGASRGAGRGASRSTGGGGTGGTGGGSGGSGGSSGSGPPGDPPGDPTGDPNKGQKHSREDDDDDDDDEPNKRAKPNPPRGRGPRQKQGKPRGGKGGTGGKQPRTRNLQYSGPCRAYDQTYPPVDDTKPVFYINRTKEATDLGYVSLPWTDAQMQQVPRGKIGWTFGLSEEVQARDYGTEGDSSLPKTYGAAHKKTAIPEVGEGDRTRL